MTSNPKLSSTAVAAHRTRERFATLTFEREMAASLPTLWQAWTAPATRPDRVHGFEDDCAGAHPTVLGRNDQSCLLQHGKVPHHGGQTQSRGISQIRHPGRPLGQLGEDRPSGRVRQGMEQQ